MGPFSVLQIERACDLLPANKTLCHCFDLYVVVACQCTRRHGATASVKDMYHLHPCACAAVLVLRINDDQSLPLPHREVCWLVRFMNHESRKADLIHPHMIQEDLKTQSNINLLHSCGIMIITCCFSGS